MRSNGVGSRDFHLRAFLEPRSNLLMAVSLALAALLTYSSSVSNGFVWDDFDIIVNNDVNRDVSNILTLFRSADSTVTGNQVAYYRPLARLTYMVDYQLFGLSPAGYHVENIIIHVAAVLLLFLLTLMLFREPLLAFVTALVFAVHPVNAEAVNFLSTRNTLLAGAFVLLSFILYLHGRHTGKTRYRYLSAMVFLGGLLCKETALMLFAALLLYDMAFPRELRMGLREKVVSLLPFAGTAAVYLAMRTYALSHLFATGPAGKDLLQRLFENSYIIPSYLKVMIFPLHLNAYYSVPDNYLTDGAWIFVAWAVVLAGLFLLPGTKRPATRFGVFWFAVNFLPLSNIVPIPSAPMAERYLYLPAMGAWLAAADQFCILFRTRFRKVAAVFGALIAICLGTLAFSRNFVWKDNVTFYSTMAKTNPDSELAHYSLGLALMERGEIARAQAEWKRTVDINPNYFNVLGLLGQSYLMQNSPREAEYYYTAAINADPHNVEALYNLALIKEKLGKPGEALFYYERFLENPPPRFERFAAAAREKVQRLKPRDR